MKKLTLIDKAFFLKNTHLFNKLNLEVLLSIADKLGAVAFEAGDVIFETGEQANLMYFIVTGTVEIQDQEKNTTTLLETNDFFGDESLFQDKPRAYSAISKNNTQILTLSKTNLLTIISESYAVGLGFLQVYASTLPCRMK